MMNLRPLLVTLSAVVVPAFASAGDRERLAQVAIENQPVADLGNGSFRNPVLIGAASDVTVCRRGYDFYMTHSGPGVPTCMIWHSRDLVNWKPVDYAVKTYAGDIWAVDLDYHDGWFYLLLPVIMGVDDTGRRLFTNMAMRAREPEGPWEGPFDLGFGRIDPGHVADDAGNRYVYVDKGYYHRISADGAKTISENETKAYDGWPIPPQWVVECHCLESPKFIRKDGWHYMISAQGGTAGPSTAHMAVVARSRQPTGLWVNSPFNPLVHTRSREEPWWRQGHGDLIDDAAGQWWMLYTGYENGYPSFGKITLLLPIEWTPDGWPRVADDQVASNILPKPAGDNIGHGLPLSDDFTIAALGLQWRRPERWNDVATIRPGDGKLVMQAGGKTIAEATRLFCTPVNHAYEVTVEIACPAGVEAGLILSGANGNDAVGAGMHAGQVFTLWRGRPHAIAPSTANHVFLRVRNDNYDISSSYSFDGTTWTRFDKGEASTGTAVISLYASGDGEAVFHNFTYRGL